MHELAEMEVSSMGKKNFGRTQNGVRTHINGRKVAVTFCLCVHGVMHAAL